MFTFNHLQKNEDDKVVHYFDFVNITTPTRSAAIAALISLRNSIDDEIALINNKLINAENSENEYSSYIAYREEVKLIVDKSLSGYEAVE